MSDPTTPPATTDDLMASIEASFQRDQRLFEITFPLNKTAIMNVLDQVGVTSVVVTFDGYGDSGQIEDIAVDGEHAELPEVAVPFTAIDYAASEPKHKTIPLREAVEDMVYQLLQQEHAGWENNDGAYGEVTFDVLERTIAFDFNERYTDFDQLHPYLLRRGRWRIPIITHFPR